MVKTFWTDSMLGLYLIMYAYLWGFKINADPCVTKEKKTLYPTLKNNPDPEPTLFRPNIIHPNLFCFGKAKLNVNLKGECGLR